MTVTTEEKKQFITDYYAGYHARAKAAADRATETAKGCRRAEKAAARARTFARRCAKATGWECLQLFAQCELRASEAHELKTARIHREVYRNHRF
jgi:hypothetical protein